MAILLVVRGFKRYQVEAFPAIIVNYFVAASYSLLFMSSRAVFTEARHLWLPSLVLGVLFVSVFYLISLTTERIGVSVASVANKMSVVIPVVLAFILYHDTISALKIAGILLALLSVVFVSLRGQQGGGAKRTNWLLPVLVFIGSGVIDALVNYAQKKIVRTTEETACLTGMFFVAAGSIGLLAFLFFYRGKEQINYKRVLLGGIVLGTPNFFSIYLVMRAISDNVLQSSVLYPLVNVGVVLGSTLGALLIFSERLSWKNWLGIALSILAIILITLA